MSQSRSRTYKLKLSAAGAGRFLESHVRLARLTSRFIPYGVTLFVGVQLLRQGSALALSEELSSPEVDQIIGGEQYFVGAPDTMRALCETMLLEQADDFPHCKPTMTRVYAAAISAMLLAEDARLLQIYNRLK